MYICVNIRIYSYINLFVSHTVYPSQLRVEVYNEHTTGAKKHIGSGTIQMSTALPSRNVSHTIVIPLWYKNMKKDKQKGIVTLTAKIVDTRSIFYECGCILS